MASPALFGKRVRDAVLVILGVAALGFAAFFAFHQPREGTVGLRMTAGQEGGTRHRIAQALRREANRRGIAIELQAMAGSDEALQAVESGRVDAALVQGGLDMTAHSALRQAAVLHIEPLHLLVKEEIHQAVSRNLGGLRGKSINLGERGSGTYSLASELMEFSGLRAGADYTESTHNYAELERELEGSRLPDAVFAVSTLPSPLARHLVTKHRYRLVSLPFWEAFALGTLDENHVPAESSGRKASRIDRRHVYDATIPAFAYEIEPGVPPEAIHTLGTRLLIVARKDMAATTIRRLLEVVFNSPFSRVLQPPLDARLLDAPPELPWHDGTTEYVRRNSPLIAGDVIDLVEKEVSILGVVAGGLFCLVQWLRRRFRRRRERSFEAYILQVARIEHRALALSREPTLDLAELLQLQDELSRIKGEALERFASGQLEGEELMSGFLVHASDARDFLMRLILHERDNLEDHARAQHRPAEVLWKEAVGEPEHAAADTGVISSRDEVSMRDSTGTSLEGPGEAADERSRVAVHRTTV
jgi:TRAP-type uncharacterized transport system substrate-binding protein